MSEEQNGSTIDETVKSGSNKSASERAKNVKKKYENSKKTLEKLKSVKALGPLIGAIGTILVVLVIIFLIIGFIGFFVTLPGLAMDQFLKACEEFWDRFTGNETIKVENESIVNLAQYIEDMGYNLVAYGFATESSITRENGESGDITDIDLSQNEESNNNTMINLSRLNFMTSGTIELMQEGGQPILPVDVLKDGNIVKITKDNNTKYYKAVDEYGKNINFYDSNGALHYEVKFKGNGQPVFTKVESGGYTIADFIGSGKEISGYTIGILGMSYNDFKTVCNHYEKKGELDNYLNKSKTDYTLENQSNVMNNVLKAISEYDIVISVDKEINIRNLFAVIENNCSRSLGTYKPKEAAEYLVNNFDGLKIIDTLLTKNNANMDEVMEAFIKATEDFMNNETEIKKKSSKKIPNLYTYVLANERTYTAQGIKQNAGEWLVGWIPGLGDLVLSNEMQSELRKLFPQNFGMIYFPTYEWDPNNASARKGNFSVSIDREDNTMLIETGGLGPLGTKHQFKWNLEGWTSRYGKPIELSLALHLSTMAPDFALNFCWDNDLQTLVTINTKSIKYKMDYSYITSSGKTVYRDDRKDDNGNVTEEGIITMYEKIKDSIPTIENGDKLFTKDIKLDTKDTKIYPIDIFDKTSIISVIEGKGEGESLKYEDSDKIYYKAVDESGNPITMFSNNKINKYKIKFDSNNMPYFEQTSEDNGYTTAEFFSSSNMKVSGTPWQEQYIDIEGKRITLEVLSLSDLGIFIEKCNIDEPNTGKNGIDGFKKQPVSGGMGDTQLYKYSCYQVYTNTLETFDAFINKVIEKGTYQSVCEKYNIELKLNLDNYKIDDSKKLTKDGETYYFNSKDNVNNDYKHSAKSAFVGIKDIDTSGENYSQGIEQIVAALSKFGEWIRADKKQIEDNYVKINIMLAQNIQEYLDEKGMDANEFITLYEVFKGLQTEADTYQPYIEKVTNHWYKDLYFKDSDEKHKDLYPEDWNNGNYTAYDEQNLSEQKFEYKPEGEAANENIDKLPGKIWCTQTPTTKGIKQNRDPLIVKTEPWHYKVKNWIMYGYYFIYDGTTATAKKIDNARSILALCGYNSNNPLLLKEFENQESGSDEAQINLNVSGTKSKEIEEKAKEYNDILKKAGSEVRLQRINFEKKSSLEAFSILEAIHTEDAEYIYRDLKEFLIELGYFTRADFEGIETDVFEWIIQGYNVYKDEWPDPKYEKNNNQYGTYIRSEVSLKKQREDEAKEKSENNDTDDKVSGVIADIKDTYNPDAGYTSVTTINGVTYKNYKQDQGSYATKKYWFEDGTWSNMADSGCGPTSAAVLLSGYGKQTSPYDIAEYIIDNTKLKQTTGTELKNALEKVGGVKATYYNTADYTREKNIENIRNALKKEKKPVMVGGSFTDDGHWVCLIGIKDDKPIISDVGNTSSLSNFTGTLEEFYDNWVTTGSYIIPNDKPSGTSNVKETVGFKAGLNVIIPESGKIIEIGEEKEKSTTDYFTTNGKYVIIEFKTNNGVNGWKMKIEGLTVDANIQEGDSLLKKGDIIGTTNDGNIKIILYDEKDAIINNAEDYFKLNTRKKNSNSGIAGDLEDLGVMILTMEGAMNDDAYYSVGDYWLVIPDPYDKENEMLYTAGGTGITNYCEKEFKETGHGDLWKMNLGDLVPKSAILEVKAKVLENKYNAVNSKLQELGINNWSETQKQAFTSATYNGAWEDFVDVMREYQYGDKDKAKWMFLNICHAMEQESLGLQYRRAIEWDIFENGANYEYTEERKRECYEKYYTNFYYKHSY